MASHLLNRLIRHRSKKTSKLRVTGHCEGNPPVTAVDSPQKGPLTQKMFPWGGGGGGGGVHMTAGISLGFFRRHSTIDTVVALGDFLSYIKLYDIVHVVMRNYIEVVEVDNFPSISSTNNKCCPQTTLVRSAPMNIYYVMPVLIMMYFEVLYALEYMP